MEVIGVKAGKDTFRRSYTGHTPSEGHIPSEGQTPSERRTPSERCTPSEGHAPSDRHTPSEGVSVQISISFFNGIVLHRRFDKTVSFLTFLPISKC
jgi:hypothetical protein